MEAWSGKAKVKNKYFRITWVFCWFIIWDIYRGPLFKSKRGFLGNKKLYPQCLCFLCVLQRFFLYCSSASVSTPHHLISAPRQNVLLHHRHHSRVSAVRTYHWPPGPLPHVALHLLNVGHIQLLQKYLFAWLSPLITPPSPSICVVGSRTRPFLNPWLLFTTTESMFTQQWPKHWNVTWSNGLLILRWLHFIKQIVLCSLNEAVCSSHNVFSPETFYFLKQIYRLIRSGWMIRLPNDIVHRWQAENI